MVHEIRRAEVGSAQPVVGVTLPWDVTYFAVFDYMHSGLHLKDDDVDVFGHAAFGTSSNERTKTAKTFHPLLTVNILKPNYLSVPFRK